MPQRIAFMRGDGRVMKFDVELVGKIGSMALIDKQDNMIDYTRVARLSRELRPGCIWVSSGATEIGRLDYIMRAGRELPDTEESKKMSGDIVKGVKLTTFQKEFFPNAYGDMLLKAAQQHKSEGEIYKIDLCDTCSHGTIEIEFKEDGAVPRFEAHTAFKQYLKDDAASDS